LHHLKDDEVGPPKTYLGAQVKCLILPEDSTTVQWGLSADQYIHNALSGIATKLQMKNQQL
jgi:hypothetical protein